MEGHGVKWPNSHQFIMEESWWTASWREEVNFESTAEREATEAHIQQWLRENDPHYKNTSDLETLGAGAKTGIPENAEMLPPAPAPTAASVPSEAERGVHPEFYGPEYDKLHEEVMKNLSDAIASWQKKKSRAEVEIAKAALGPFAGPVVENLKQQLDDVTAKAVALSEVFETF